MNNLSSFSRLNKILHEMRIEKVYNPGDETHDPAYQGKEDLGWGYRKVKGLPTPQFSYKAYEEDRIGYDAFKYKKHLDDQHKQILDTIEKEKTAPIDNSDAIRAKFKKQQDDYDAQEKIENEERERQRKITEKEIEERERQRKITEKEIEERERRQRFAEREELANQRMAEREKAAQEFEANHLRDEQRREEINRKFNERQAKINSTYNSPANQERSGGNTTNHTHNNIERPHQSNKHSGNIKAIAAGLGAAAGIGLGATAYHMYKQKQKNNKRGNR